MKNYLTIILLILIMVLGVTTRFYKLGQAPAGLYIDEAGQGYSAYSILRTGQDEFGKSFPFIFRSFTDFKTPVYIYLVVPLIPIFGLNAFTVRLPSFIFSILTFPIIFLLIKKISPDKDRLATVLALTVTLLLAISPWHILFGRTNFECNVALFFFLAAVYIFYLALDKPKLFILSAVLFAIAIPSYHSQRIVTPLIILVLVIRHRQKIFIKQNRVILGSAAILGLLISLPTLSVATTPGFLARAAGLNIFSHLRQLPAGFLENYHGIFGGFINNPIFLSTQEFLSLYFSYLSPRFMFILGDYGPRSSFPQLSTFFIWQFPFYIYGLWLIIKEKSLNEVRFFTLALLLIAPIPAAVTRDPYSTIRALPLVIPQTIIISLGLIYAFRNTISYCARFKIHTIMVKNSFILISVLVICYSLFKLHSSVIVLNEYYRAKYWDYGWQQVTSTIQGLSNLPVIVDNSRNESYISLLFFLKYPPEIYQKQNFEVPITEYYTNMSRNTTKTIGNIIIRQISWKEDLLQEQYLVGDNLSISDNQIKEHHLTIIKDIRYPDTSIAFRIVKTNP